MPVLYTAHTNVTGGREGTGETDDKKLSVTLSRPGSTGTGTNPEQLFAVGYVGFVAGHKELETAQSRSSPRSR